jgi:hypothetical protein
MIIPSSTHGIIASSRKKNTVSAPTDVTPNAVTWSEVYYNNDIGEYFYSEKQITGINTPITLKVQFTAPFGGIVYYHVSNVSGDIVSGDNGSLDAPSSNSTAIANNGTFSVSNNQYVTFSTIPTCGEFFAITVKNQSDGDVVFDTFNTTFIGEC